MNPIPCVPGIGDLRIVEVYEYYDGPVLFASRNTRDELFLVSLCHDGQPAQEWFVVPTSRRRHQHIRSGGIDLYTAFKAVEGGHVLRIIVPRDGSKPTHRWVQASVLDDAELPLAGERLDLPTETLVARPDQVVQDIAIQTHREVVTLRMDFRDVHRSEAPADRLGKLLSGFQELLNAIGQRTLGSVAARGRIAVNVIEEMRLDVAGVFPGSFGVELHARKNADLFGDSAVGDALETLVALISSADDDAALATRLEQAKGRAASKFRDLALTVVGSADNMAVQWGSPKRGRGGGTSLSLDGAKRAIAVIGRREPEQPVEFTVHAKLIGINVRTKTYEVWDLEENRKYAGRVVDAALPTVEHATINARYYAQIREEERTVGV